MKARYCLFAVICSLAVGCHTQSQTQYSSEMIKDVIHLVEAAARHERAWEWDGECTPEVDRVARHGEGIAPLLVDLLDHGKEWTGVDEYIGFDQQIQLALCKIFEEQPKMGVNVYGETSAGDVATRAAPEK